MSYRFEPHDLIYSAGLTVRDPLDAVAGSGVGRGVPGVVGTGWVPGGAIPGYYPDPPRYPYLVIFEVQIPTYGQMKAIL